MVFCLYLTLKLKPLSGRSSSLAARKNLTSWDTLVLTCSCTRTTAPPWSTLTTTRSCSKSLFSVRAPAPWKCSRRKKALWVALSKVTRLQFISRTRKSKRSRLQNPLSKLSCLLRWRTTTSRWSLFRMATNFCWPPKLGPMVTTKTWSLSTASITPALSLC